MRYAITRQAMEKRNRWFNFNIIQKSNKYYII